MLSYSFLSDLLSCIVKCKITSRPISGFESSKLTYPEFSKVLLRNTIPVDKVKDVTDDYEITPEFSYEFKNGKVLKKVSIKNAVRELLYAIR